MVQKGGYVIAHAAVEEEATRNDDEQQQDYPIAEAVPIVNAHNNVNHYHSEGSNNAQPQQENRPSSVNPSYHDATFSPIQLPVATTDGRNPVTIRCPHCQLETITRTRKKTSCLQWILVGALYCVGWFYCLCCIPFCCTSCRDTDHYCTNCDRKILRVGPFSP